MAEILRFPYNEYVITVYLTKMNEALSLTRDGSIVNNGRFLNTEFANSGVRLHDHVMLGKLGSENFNTKGKYLKDIGFTSDARPTDLMTEFLQSQGVDVFEFNVWIIVPKPNKALTGIKYDMQFRILSEDLKTEKDYILPVYMTPITPEVKEVMFKMYAPEWLYKKAMEHADESSRPSVAYVESPSLSYVREWLNDLSIKADTVNKIQKDSEKYRKVIAIEFLSGKRETRDDRNFAYLGLQINTQFRYYIAYEYQDSWGVKKYFSWKRLESPSASLRTNVNGVVDYEKQNRKNHFSGKIPGQIIDWTQDRENFLESLQEKFCNLSDNLNQFLKDLNEEKLELLMQNAPKLLG